jgi:hypothetical protein
MIEGNKMGRKIIKDESGVNVIIEYLMSFAIIMVLFTIVILMYQSSMARSNTVAMNEELKIYAGDIANRIVTFDRMVNTTEARGGTIGGFENDFDTPTQITGMTYSIILTDNSVQLQPLDRNIMPVSISFKTSHKVTPTTVPSSALNHVISYNKITHEIEVK